MNRTLWEYKTLKSDAEGLLGGKFDAIELDDALNREGAVGWEVVGLFTTNQDFGSTRHIVAILKRPRHT